MNLRQSSQRGTITSFVYTKDAAKVNESWDEDTETGSKEAKGPSWRQEECMALYLERVFRGLSVSLNLGRNAVRSCEAVLLCSILVTPANCLHGPAS